jgi:inner membrane protein
MEALIELMSGYGAWNWLILALLLFTLETFVPGVHFVWFGLAAAVVGLITFGFDITWQWQLLLFATLAVASVFWVRQFSSSYIRESDEPELNVRGNQYIGRVVTVEHDFAGGRGRVRVDDTLWSASGEGLKAGDKVRITAVKGTVFSVESTDG